MAVLCLCGPSGCGKTTVGRAVARGAGCDFLDADDLHPPANRRKMAEGTPLADADRAPWLRAVRREAAARAGAGRRVVLACSALKASYRRVLSGAAGADEEAEAEAAAGHSAAPAAAQSPSGGGGGATPVDIAFVLLNPPRPALEARVRAREAAGRHFMPAALLGSQLAALETGGAADWLLVIDDDRPPEAAAAAVLEAWLGPIRRGS
ncbi:hypothetical protein Rsub_04929 [Raphidocelis subcapitata]|uniref:gluconokinase n=1 Tax=Raphidocelis subcapitata TaxID=307507 RepID=A0A2V0NW09_9CHLO|nr:hypothetical protein Rsub_04929 [Raphidocelis subcapitata]|eukprot:GBF91824.1 hypothetical protein Rsub_04929 [Raphidocelis subcapitata]